MGVIFHIAEAGKWPAKLYEPSSLESEGFVHCSTGEQLVDTANRLFHGKGDLLVLVIDSQRLRAEVKFEKAPDGSGEFPHVYGPIGRKAVVGVYGLPAGADGSYDIAAVDQDFRAMLGQ
jgi:uncharacterized protein (DUF952 family)